MKKRMCKIMALAMTAAMVVPMAAQTTAFAADDKEITYWNIAVESPDKDIVTAAVDKFNKETESGYTVNSVAIQNDTYKEKLVIAMSSGECPDMYSSWSGGPMYEYIDSGFAQPIDDLLDQSDIKDKLLDAAIEQGSYNGHVYAIPYLNVSLAGIFYNKDMFKQYGLEEPKTLADLENICATLKENGIQNILALRGDVNPDLAPVNEFKHANELIEFIKLNGDFDIMAACYPEGHNESSGLVEDIVNLKRKVDSGVDHLITQLFLDNNYFYSFYERTQIAGINVPIEAGIMPVTNKIQIERMVKLCGINLPKKFMKMIEKYENNPIALRDAGIAYAIDQIVDLISQGIDGIHLYTMNKPYVANKAYDAIKNLISYSNAIK